MFAAMRRGEFEEGQHVLRARIDMASPNMNLRDPTLYRIRKVPHQRTGDAWCIYPMYDFAHTLSDELEGTTHSLCTLEFEDHRPLYEWFLDNLPVANRPEQTEFSRFNLMFTIMSKRKLSRLVDEGHVDGWDDPRMPTLSGMRRRGYTAASIRDFIGRIGVTKKDNLIELGALENCVREDLNTSAPRRFGVLRPLKVTIENYPEDGEEWLTCGQPPEQARTGHSASPLLAGNLHRARRLSRGTTEKIPPTAPRGARCGCAYAYIIKCEEVVKDASGEIIELRCSYDPLTRSGMDQAQRKVKGTIHWVCGRRAVHRKVRLYDRLFRTRTRIRARRIPAVSQSRLARGARRGARTGTGDGVARRTIPVRATGLFHAGPGSGQGRGNSLPAHHYTERLVGENRARSVARSGALRFASIAPHPTH